MKEKRAQTILGILYTVGVIGYLSPITANFISLTCLNLLISLGAVLYFHPSLDIKFIIVCSTVYLLGFTAEIIGINTGILFGSYNYGGVMGIQFLNTPFIIGVNWLLLTYCTAAFCWSIFSESTKKYLIPLAASLLMVSLDVLIEPVAQKYNLWQWQSGYPPLKNYFHWFIISAVMQYVFYFGVGVFQNQTARFVFFLQFIFFFILFQFVK